MFEFVLICLIVTLGLFLTFKITKMRREAKKLYIDKKIEECDTRIKHGKYMLKKAKRKLKESGSKNASRDVERWKNYIESWEKEKYGYK